MIRDRGEMKWQPAHFLPEQKNLLNELYDNAAKQKKPIIDEQAQEQISILIMGSLHYTMQISIITWNNGHFNKITCIVDKLD
ncbi:YolD-like family protein [Bacillus sp. CRN 9]|nr:YolD-like family protein [Bacillus sp. CRN 9]